MNFLNDLFGSGPFMPHGHCYFWTKGLIALHAISDALIVLAYYSIPVTLVYFVRKRQGLQFHWMFVCFAVFIMACGTTHLMEIWNVWHANYWLSGSIKAITALASVPTAILLVKLVPRALALPSQSQLTRVNEALQTEITERKQVEARLREANESLEARVRERTKELAQTNEALRVSEERFRIVVEAAPSGMLMVDEQGEMQLVNGQMEKLFGYARAELLGEPVELLVPLRFRDGHPELRGGFFQRPSARAMGAGRELFGRRKDGSEVPIEIGLNPIRIGSGTFVLASIIDITERRRAEEEIKKLNADLERRVVERTAELEAANQELEAFSYSVSHDLRAPLRGIAGFSKILVQDYESKLDEEGKRIVGVIQNETQRMGRLIDALLRFSRLGRQQMNFGDLDMTALTKAILQEITALGFDRVPRFEVATLPPARGDDSLIRQVLVNLLSNAIKFTRHKEAPLIEVGGRSEADYNLYYVKDNGVGFDEQYAGKLFGVFQRLHSEAEFGGTGVGLALVQRIIHRHGGRVWAEARPNAGATFFFTLPT